MRKFIFVGCIWWLPLLLIALIPAFWSIWAPPFHVKKGTTSEVQHVCKQEGPRFIHIYNFTYISEYGDKIKMQNEPEFIWYSDNSRDINNRKVRELYKGNVYMRENVIAFFYIVGLICWIIGAAPIFFIEFYEDIEEPDFTKWHECLQRFFN